jgi:hypothetical protein
LSFSFFFSLSSSSFKESVFWRASKTILIAPSSFEEVDSACFCSRALSVSREVYYEAKTSREEITAQNSEENDKRWLLTGSGIILRKFII